MSGPRCYPPAPVPLLGPALTTVTNTSHVVRRPRCRSISDKKNNFQIRDEEHTTPKTDRPSATYVDESHGVIKDRLLKQHNPRDWGGICKFTRVTHLFPSSSSYIKQSNFFEKRGQMSHFLKFYVKFQSPDLASGVLSRPLSRCFFVPPSPHHVPPCQRQKNSPATFCTVTTCQLNRPKQPS